ncbi:TIGR04086 family membrane protein [Fictibacillus sp. Mic-4]|uniref:TIGR04086 family membrane protein n=1 Tax=Fictibacillus TaxID=1329200 RepID=UPI00040CFF0B|nr:TIGR04086 family membrane protein [Fictibacillus gelatini]
METRHMGSAIVRGLITILILILLSSVILSLILRFSSVTESKLNWVTLALSLISWFIGGFVSGKSGKEKGWLLGATTAIVFSLLVFLVQFLGFDSTFNSKQYMYHGIFLLLSILGGIMGVNSSQK